MISLSNHAALYHTGFSQAHTAEKGTTIFLSDAAVRPA